MEKWTKTTLQSWTFKLLTTKRAESRQQHGVELLINLKMLRYMITILVKRWKQPTLPGSVLPWGAAASSARRACWTQCRRPERSHQPGQVIETAVNNWQIKDSQLKIPCKLVEMVKISSNNIYLVSAVHFDWMFQMFWEMFQFIMWDKIITIYSDVICTWNWTFLLLSTVV